jgi:transposase
VTPKSMHDWIKKYGDTGSQHQTITGQQDELRQLKAQLRRVTEERDILKEAAVDSIDQRNTLFHNLFGRFEFQCFSRALI